jgi:FkbM family methyltransferase
VLIRLERFAFYMDAEEPIEGLLFDAYEPATSFVFERLVTPGDLVVDAGAHWGYFTLLAATLCGETGRVIAFEPHPRNVSVLTKNLRANHLDNVDVVAKAVSDREGPAKLFLSRGSGGSSLNPVPPEFSSAQNDYLSVETVTLDRFFADSGRRPALVKIDIEGAEPAAFEGMKTLIRETPDLVLITEFNPFYLPGAGGEAFLERLMEQALELAIIDDARFRIEAGAPQQVLQQALNKGYTVNLLAARPWRIARVLSSEAISGASHRRAPKIVRL